MARWFSPGPTSPPVIVLLVFGKFDYLGWQGRPASLADRPLAMAPAIITPTIITPTQAATLKLMVVAGLLFLTQVLIGGALAHARADPGSFYGLDLSTFMPSNLLRIWHLQLAIFWVATAYVGGALFVAAGLGGGDPHPPDHQSWPCRLRRGVWHVSRRAHGLCAARGHQPRGLALC